MSNSSGDELATGDTTTYVARWIVPVAGLPIENGALVVRGERIVGFGPRRAAEGRVVDLGDAVVLPGFINAHAHLEFSGLAKPLGRPGLRFDQWLRQVIAYRRSPQFDARVAVVRGAAECRRRGTTTVGDIASTLPEQLLDEPPDGVSATAFVELIGFSEGRAAAERVRLNAFLQRPGGPTVRRGISPHAPYTVRPALLEWAVARSVEQRLPVAFHLAESREELQLLQTGDGPLVDYLRELGAWDEEAIPRGTRPLDYLRTLSQASRAVVVHGNYLADDEIEFLAARADRMTTVYCPRTQAHFDHAPHPLSKLLAAGAAVALGTDGRCTNPDLDLAAEMRFVAARFPQLAPERILQLGTLDGARALGLHDEIGSLESGKHADFVALRGDATIRDPAEAWLDACSHIVGVWHRGRQVEPSADSFAAD